MARQSIIVDEHGISRDIYLFENKGKHYFELRENNVVIMQSDLFENNESAYIAGLALLDALHEERPLQVNHRDDILITAR